MDEAFLVPLTTGVAAYPLSELVGNAQVHPVWSLVLSRLWVR